ncbi:MAG: hypothetical protein C4562_00005, partial [Actinobacteria bacterium]
GYIGYPLALKLAGNQGLVKAIFYDLFGTVLFILTIGLIIAQHYGDQDKKINIIKELLTFPAIIALVLGLAFKPVVIPAIILVPLVWVGKLTIYLIAISVGLNLELSEVKGYYLLFAAVCFLKLIISPLMAFGLSGLFRLDGQASLIAILEASMPPAMLSLVLGLRYKLNVSFLSSAIFIASIISLFTIPLFQLVAAR